MKKIFLTLLSAALVTGFISCNGKGDSDKATSADSTKKAQQDDAANMVSKPDSMKTSVSSDADKKGSDNKMKDTKGGDNKMKDNMKDGGKMKDAAATK